MAISKIILNGVTQMDLTADTVAANNLIAPNTAHGANGEPVVGVASGGSSAWTKVAETSYQVNTTSGTVTTVATWETGHSEIWTANKVVLVRVRDTAGKRAGYFYGSDNYFYNKPDDSITSLMRVSIRYTTTNKYAFSTTTSTSGYGVFLSSITSNGDVQISARYGSSSSLTINGTYKVEVYLLDLPTGAPIFE